MSMNNQTPACVLVLHSVRSLKVGTSISRALMKPEGLLLCL